MPYPNEIVQSAKNELSTIILAVVFTVQIFPAGTKKERKICILN
jgi:hypothetical protein